MRKSALIRRGGSLASVNIASRLDFAATPTFGLMALISAADSPGITICSTALPLAAIDSMALMYLLMTLFHLPPWLKLLSNRLGSRIHQSEGD